MEEPPPAGPTVWVVGLRIVRAFMRTGVEAATAGDNLKRRVANSVLLGSVLILLSVLLAYLPALRGGFIWDDDAYVKANPLLTAPDGWKRIWFSTHSQSQYFPMTFTTLRLEHALWGMNPSGYHAVNVFLHSMNALLVWALLRRLAVPGAWFAAALFALHPVQVESAAWITELKNTQSTLFCLLTLLAWLRFADQESSGRWFSYALALWLYVLALLSKTTACTLPAAMVLALWLRNQPLGWRRLAGIAPFLLLGVSLGLVSVWWEGHLGNYVRDSGVHMSWLERLLIATRAIWFYAGKLVWPVNLSFSYPRWDINPRDLAQYGWGLGCGVVAALFWWRRRAWGRGPVAAILFFVATLSPMLGFFPLYTFVYTFVADHYQYLACLGPMALFAAGLARLAARWQISLAAQRAFGLALLSVLGVLTWQQAGHYRDLETLWRDTLRKSPNSWLAFNNLGMVLSERGQKAEAEACFIEVIRIKPDFSWGAHNALGMIRSAEGKRAEAEAHFLEALRLKPNDPDIQYNLANLLVAAGRSTEAIAHYQHAIEFKPDDPDIHNNLGVVLYSMKQFEPAAREFRAAIRCQPGSANFHCNLGNALLALRQWDQAAQAYAAALRLDAHHAEAQTRLRALTPLPASPAHPALNASGRRDN
jgi:protein O-mannosyl-transferase